MKRPWSDFENVTSSAKDVRSAIDDLVHIADYRKEERLDECRGHDPLIPLLAYAQDSLVYDEDGRFVPIPDRDYYNTMSRHERVNKFGLAYREDAPFLLHKTLADILVGAAIYLHQSQGWTTIVYDGLRTVEGAYNLHVLATDDDIKSGLLALPGYSAHNKGLAVDSMMLDGDGREVEMGGHFDHLDMSTNIRTYRGPLISETAKQNRLIREEAFLRGALTQGLLVAPLRNEFWDDRLPENREDLWRVLDSAARVMGIDLLSAEDETLRRRNRSAFYDKWESWSYADFLAKWAEIFDGLEGELKKVFGVNAPPAAEKFEFYHGNYHPIYDRDLRAINLHLTN